MLPGRRIGDVAEAASMFLSQKYPHMLPCLPKVCRMLGCHACFKYTISQSLGFGLGLDYHEAALLLNSKNSLGFSPNMVFNLAIGFHNIALEPSDKVDAMGSVCKLAEYSMLVSDTVLIRACSGVVKHSRR